MKTVEKFHILSHVHRLLFLLTLMQQTHVSFSKRRSSLRFDIHRSLQKVGHRLSELKSQLEGCPSGTLQISKSRHYYTYRQKTADGKVLYIPKNQEEMARQLAFKKYLELQIEELENALFALQLCQKQIEKCGDKAAKYLYENEGASRLLKDAFPIRNAPLAAWAAQPPAVSAPYQEARVQRCRSGHIVRSKSERMIDNALYAAQIPFRYEDPLTRGSSTIHPDFTLRHPLTGEFLYWEHFGMMDKPAYVNRAMQSLALYAGNGYYPFHNLIVTFEAACNPLSDAQIDLMIDYYLGA